MKAYIRKPNYVTIRNTLAVVDDDGRIVEDITGVDARPDGFWYYTDAGASYFHERGVVIEVPIDGYLPGEEGFDPNWIDKRKPGAPDIETVRDQSLDRLKNDLLARADAALEPLTRNGGLLDKEQAASFKLKLLESLLFEAKAELFKASWERMVLLACHDAPGLEEGVADALAAAVVAFRSEWRP